MNCKDCIYYYIESRDRITRDSTNDEARKCSCRKNLFSLYTERELNDWMNKRKFCYPKMESKISLSISVIALFITVFFPIWQTYADKRDYIKKEDVELINHLKGFSALNNEDSIKLRVKEVILNVDTFNIRVVKPNK